MTAYAEGFNVLKHANAGKQSVEHDAETTPLRHPEHYQYDFDIGAIAEVWRHGSVIGSWLLDLTAGAFARNGSLDGFAGRVSDSGEGRWALAAATEVGAPSHVLAAALWHLAGVELVHVPYRGAQAAYQDLLGGRVDLFFDLAACLPTP